MVELAYVDPVHGNVVITFDGSAAEFFVEGKASVSRVHVRLLHVQAQGPHRKGFYEVDFSSSPRGLGGFKTYVPGETWPQFYEFLQAVSAVTGR